MLDLDLRVERSRGFPYALDQEALGALTPAPILEPQQGLDERVACAIDVMVGVHEAF